MDRHLQLLGAPAIHAGDARAPLLGPGKPLAVLAILAIAPGRTVTRDHLVDQLWADAPRDAARQTLRQTLYYLRKKAGEVVVTDGDHVRLAEQVRVDRDELLLALDRGDDERALALYTGEFFPAFAAPGGAQFEQTAELERARLRGFVLRAGAQRSRSLVASGHTRDAIALATRLRGVAPYDHLPWRLLVEALVASGDDLGAETELEAYRAWCLREDEAVDRQVVELVARAGAGAARSPDARGVAAGAPAASDGSRDRSAAAMAGAPTDDPPPALASGDLVGREEPLSLLLGAWREARRGHGRHVHVMAPAGLGKTRLLDGLARRLDIDGRLVVAVRATPADRGIPYALAADLAAALVACPGAAGISSEGARVVVGLAPAASAWLRAEPERADGGDALRRRTLAVEELLAAVADESPIAVLVDDLHWADDASRALLGRLGTAVARQPALLVTAARPSLREVGDGVEVLVLPPLTPAQVEECVRSLGELPQVAWADRLPAQLHAASGGVPLVVHELLRLATERGLLVHEDGTWMCPDPDALGGLFTGGGPLARLVGALADEERQLLLLLALLGVPVTEAALAGAWERPVRTSLTLLERRGLARCADGVWEVAHDEVADAAAAAATAEERRTAHTRAACVTRSLEAVGDRRHVYAARHAIAARDGGRAAQDFAALVIARHAIGDAPAQAAIAREVLGDAADQGDVTRLVQSLPWRVRVNGNRVGAIGAVAASVLMLAAVVAWRGTSPRAADAGEVNPVVASLLIPARDAGGSVMLEADIRADDLRAGDAGRITPRVAEGWPLGAEDRRLSALAFEQARGDTLYGFGFADPVHGMDAFAMVRGEDSLRILSAMAGDEGSFAWSPDGRYAAIVHADVPRTGHFDTRILLFDRLTDDTTELVPATARHHTPMWSPSGGRLAFLARSSAPEEPARACWVSLDGAPPVCVPIAIDDATPEVLLGWADEQTVYLSATPIASAAGPGLSGALLFRVPIGTGRAERVPRTPGCGAWWIDPSGRLAMCYVIDGPMQRITAYDLANAGRRAVLALPGSVAPRDVRLLFRLSVAPAPSLRIETSRDSVAVGRWLPLAATLGTPTSRSASPWVRWRSLDPAVATVTAVGVARGVAPGLARLEACLRPDVCDTMSIVVHDAVIVAAFEEQWTAPTDGRWIPVGTPPARVIDLAGDGPALLLDGDGINLTEMYAARAVDATRGAGVEARVRLRVTQAFHQLIHVALASLPGEALRAWRATAPPDADVLSGALSASSVPSICAVRAPGVEGGDRTTTIGMAAAHVPHLIEGSTIALTDGAWHTVRLQRFADGRCGVAIDGRAVFVSPNRAASADSVRVVLSGSSVGTQALVGTVTVWSGERDDVDWAAAMDRALESAGVLRP